MKKTVANFLSKALVLFSLSSSFSVSLSLSLYPFLPRLGFGWVGLASETGLDFRVRLWVMGMLPCTPTQVGSCPTSTSPLLSSLIIISLI